MTMTVSSWQQLINKALTTQYAIANVCDLQWAPDYVRGVRNEMTDVFNSTDLFQKVQIQMYTIMINLTGKINCKRTGTRTL